MKIGLITGEYPPMQGGVGDFTHELGKALVELEQEVHVLTTKSPASDSDLDSQITVHRAIDNWGWGCWRQILTLAQELELEMLNVQYQAAAYGMHPAINFVPRRQNRPPVVVTFHDLKVPYLFPKAGPLRWQVVRMLARRAERIIVTNQEDYVQLEPEFSYKRLSLIPIGSNIPVAPPSGYSRDAERGRWGVGADDVLLGYFGFLNESKGGEELMQALALLVEQEGASDRGSHHHLLMIGGRVGSSDPTNQTYADRVESLISKLGIEERVHWTGYSYPKSVSAGMLAMDMCVLPYRDGVSFRRGTLHACLVHGRAVITTYPAIPLPEAQDGVNMLLVQPRDPQGLAEAVTRLTCDPALQKQLEAGATSLASEFTWERIARHTAALFRRI
ncbi:MAG: glycosyltransferase family 4 protein [Chloroflexi bacterium]|nr:glycosyltransferase family 4 protein [Chloroflexota bacterium]